MVELSFKINGNNAGTPKNAREIKIISNWGENTEDDNSEAEVSTNVLEFALEDAKVINDHVSKGLSGGVGIFEGIPYEIIARDKQNNLVQQVLNGYIDLVDQSTFISCDEVEATIKKRKNLDWFSSFADSFSFAYLAQLQPLEKGYISEADYVHIPYVLNFRPDNFELVMIGTSLFIMLKETYEATFMLIESGADLAETFNPLPDVGDALAASIKFAARAAYLGLILIAVKELAEQLLDQLFPPIRRYKGMYVKTLFERSCEYMGLEFASTIFEDPKFANLVFIPTKERAGKIGGGVFLRNNPSKPEEQEAGHPNQGSAIYNAGDFYRVMKQMFYANIKIEGNVLRFERVDYWDQKASVTLPGVETDQQLRLSKHRYNTDEANSNFLVNFSTDPSDLNTLENFLGTNYQVMTQPNIINEKEFVNLGGVAQVNLPFALPTGKTTLTDVEDALLSFARVVDGVTNFFNTVISFIGVGSLFTPTNYASKITQRLNYMSLSNDIIGVDKIGVFYPSGTNKDLKVPPTASIDFNFLNPRGFVTELQAYDLYHLFYVASSFAEANDYWNTSTADRKAGKFKKVSNQAKVFEGVEIPMCLSTWQSLQSNNTFNTSDGKVGTIIRLEWDLQNERAIVDYKIKEVYTKNLKLVPILGV